MIKTHALGFPRIGENRELKFALERYWRGEIDTLTLHATAAQLREKHWQVQSDAGLDFVTVGDFAFYDHIANHIQWLGCVPKRFGPNQAVSALDIYFGMARGASDGQPPLAMTKWFDTNYHYLVPEFDANTSFTLNSESLLEQVQQAKDLGHSIKVSLIGPVTFLWLGKEKNTSNVVPFDRLALLEQLVQVYAALLRQLHAMGVEWVQLDEPILGLDLHGLWTMALERAYHSLQHTGVKIMLASYFSPLQGNLSIVCRLPIAGLHIDAVRCPEEINSVVDWLGAYKTLSLGIIDGRNIWRSNFAEKIALIENTLKKWTGPLWLSSSCSLLHVPYKLSGDQGIAPEVLPWLCGAVEKLSELNTLKRACNEGAMVVAAELVQNLTLIDSRKNHCCVHQYAVSERLSALPSDADQRKHGFEHRKAIQAEKFQLPLFPTTTIGSFPQTDQIRQLRAAFKRKDISSEQYENGLRKEIAFAVAKQEALGLDVLVHGEAERNDMVEYFGEQLSGFTFSANGWVQSYGSRCVKPPIIYGDVSRPTSMTVEWTRYAQGLTTKPIKGMLTGPVTVLQWSFVRDDQARETTALQIALAIRDEVCDLEAAGIQMIQIDEPAIREGLPLRRALWSNYLNWAGKAFRVAASGVGDATQIHTHMCYSEFNDILPEIAAMDADVITIETSRSDMELLTGFAKFKYLNDIGPGVYDIHSPHIPSISLMVWRLTKAAEVIAPERLWVNPDCGLKTRNWTETEIALRNMVSAAKLLRSSHNAFDKENASSPFCLGKN